MTPSDPRERFGGAAREYARYRPGYPASLVDWVVREAGVGPGARVADIGCGTGLFTRLLGGRGLDVVGIDPNEDMLREARAAGGEAAYRAGEAAATGLPDGSVNLVTAAQAFHWFDIEATLTECERVLRPGGRVAAVWNIRGESAFMAEYDRLLQRYSREYSVLDSWESTLEALEAHPRTLEPRRRAVPHAQQFDIDGFRGRVWSSSYVRHGVEAVDAFEADLRALFDLHACDGQIEFPYRAVALVFRPAG